MKWQEITALVYFCSNATHDIHLKEWKLVYYPKNDILEQFLSEVVELLRLDGIEGVNSTEDVEKVMIERELFCGVVFEHFAVSEHDINVNFSNQIVNRLKENQKFTLN